MSFCDECGAQFLRASSKWCSECGVSRGSHVVEAGENVANVGGNESIEDCPISHLWILPELPNLTLYDRVYGQRPKGLPRNITWGKSFLKQYHCFKKQYKQLKKNQEVVRNWFMPGKSEFVDEFLKSPSLRWNQFFIKKLRRYCREMRSSLDIDDKILDINFPEHGIKLSWRGCDILKYAFEIKHYRKSTRSIPRAQRLVGEEPSNETLAIMPSCTSFVEREGACSEETLPIAPPNANLEEGASGEVVPRGLGPRKKRVPAKLRDT